MSPHIFWMSLDITVTFFPPPCFRCLTLIPPKSTRHVRCKLIFSVLLLQYPVIHNSLVVIQPAWGCLWANTRKFAEGLHTKLDRVCVGSIYSIHCYTFLLKKLFLQLDIKTSVKFPVKMKCFKKITVAKEKIVKELRLGSTHKLNCSRCTEMKMYTSTLD